MKRFPKFIFFITSNKNPKNTRSYALKKSRLIKHPWLDLGQGRMESTSSAVDRAGLNPNRQRGFDVNFPRMETPTLSDMRARQGAIVAKFLTFFQRKSSLVIELYNGVFYRQKPTWDKIADFVSGDLCTIAELRKEIKDVQYHPVKMLIFIKLSDDKYRDMLVDKLQSAEGVIWKDYGVKVNPNLGGV